jgi:hypothetical protein
MRIAVPENHLTVPNPASTLSLQRRNNDDARMLRNTVVFDQAVISNMRHIPLYSSYALPYDAYAGCYGAGAVNTHERADTDAFEMVYRKIRLRNSLAM